MTFLQYAGWGATSQTQVIVKQQYFTRRAHDYRRRSNHDLQPVGLVYAADDLLN
jgi:hypothetical protein